jgi:hypothetical protein
MKRSQAVLLLAVLLVAAVQLASAQAAPEERFQKSFALANGGTIEVQNYKGLIRIEAAEQQQVTVDVWKRYLGSDDKYREEWLRQTSVNLDSAGDRVKVRVEYPSHMVCIWNCDNEGGVVELVIRTPKNVNLQIDGYKPEMKIIGTHGNIRIHSYKSEMDIRDTSGGIDIDTYKGDIRLDGVALNAPLRLHNYKADTTITARTLDHGADLETSKGSITLRLPADTRANLDISGDRRARIESGFAINLQSAGFASRHISGAINGGGPQLRIRTDKGSIVLQKIGGGV